MTPKAQELYNFLERNAERYAEPVPDANPQRTANRAEWARLLRVAAAAVEKEGQAEAPVREAAE